MISMKHTKKGAIDIPIGEAVVIILALLFVAAFAYYYFIAGEKLGAYNYNELPGVSDFFKIAGG